MEKIVRSRRGTPKMRKKNRRSDNSWLERMSSNFARGEGFISITIFSSLVSRIGIFPQHCLFLYYKNF